MEKSAIEDKLKEMIWDINWKNNDNFLEKESNIERLQELFEFAIKYNLTDKIDFLRLNINDFRILKKDYSDVLKKALVTLFMKNVKDISLSELEELKKDFNIQYIQINSLHSLEKDSTMNLQIVYKYKKAIMKLLKEIDENYLKEDPNREKAIFGIVLSRIIDKTQYDENAQDKYYEKQFNSLNRKIVLRKKIHNYPSNEMLGLLKGKCVCRGYAGIIRDVFNEIGIDVNVITGLNPDIGIGHAWNQIKLDGQWYNIDVTWDIKYMSYRAESYWLLKDDKYFENGITIQNEKGTIVEAHRFFSTNRTSSLPCDKSLSQEELRKYIDIEKIRKKLWLKRFLTKLEEKQKEKSR